MVEVCDKCISFSSVSLRQLSVESGGNWTGSIEHRVKQAGG